jgi:hypothetical protein
VCDALNEGFAGKTVVAAGATNVLIGLGNVASAKMLLLRALAHDPTEAPVELFFRRNSPTGEEISVKPLEGTKEAALLLTGTITALYVSNPGTIVMDVILAVAGD